MISREQIDEILDRVDIVDIISEHVALNRKGSNYLGLCPFHSEKTPSFSVSRDRNMYYCFGCHESGNVISFLMNYEGLTFVEAVEVLAEKAGVVIEQKKQNFDNTFIKLKEINRLAAVYFYNELRGERGSLALRYLKNRGVSDEMMRTFGLGYAPYTKETLYNQLKKQGYADDLLKKSGLFSYYSDKGFRDKFFDRVMFPIMDKNGKVVAFGGRTMSGEGAKYLNSPETDIFHKKKILYGLNIAKRARSNYLILCEGYMDVIAMHQHGFNMTVATLGTAFTDEHALEVRKLVHNVYMLYDSDNAGQNATIKAAKALVNAGISVKVISIAPYKDPDECLNAKGAEFMNACIENAVPEIYFRIDAQKKKYDLLDPVAKLRFIGDMASILCDYSKDYIVVATKDIAEHYYIDLDLFKKCVSAAKNNKEYSNFIEEEKRNSQKVNIGRKASVEKSVLWWLTREGLFDKVNFKLKEEYFRDEDCRIIYKKMIEEYSTYGRIEEHKFLARFEDAEKIKLITEIFKCNNGLLSLGGSDFEKSLNEALRKLVSDYYDSKLKENNDFEMTIKLISDKKQVDSSWVSIVRRD